MRVLQFGFSTNAEDEKFLPHRYVPHCVVYTGTHDNDTSRGWLTSTHVQTTQFAEQVQTERAYALRYLGGTVKDFHWDMIRLALSSIAEIAIIPMQDLLGLDSSARMNVPGKAEGNWGWRFRAPQLTAKVKDHFAALTAVYARWNGAIPVRLDPHHVPTDPEMAKTPEELRRRRSAGGQAQTTTDPEEKPTRGDSARKRGMKPRKTGPKQASLARDKKMKPR